LVFEKKAAAAAAAAMAKRWIVDVAVGVQSFLHVVLILMIFCSMQAAEANLIVRNETPDEDVLVLFPGYTTQPILCPHNTDTLITLNMSRTTSASPAHRLRLQLALNNRPGYLLQLDLDLAQLLGGLLEDILVGFVELVLDVAQTLQGSSTYVDSVINGQTVGRIRVH
jgi:hypothetical protein